MKSQTDKIPTAFLAGRPAWRFDGTRNAIHRLLQLATFGEALAAMVRIGFEAEKMAHHPEWSNVYGTLNIWLTTHDSGGVSDKDFALADIIDQVAPPSRE